MVLCHINRYQNLPGGREGEAPFPLGGMEGVFKLSCINHALY